MAKLRQPRQSQWHRFCFRKIPTRNLVSAIALSTKKPMHESCLTVGDSVGEYADGSIQDPNVRELGALAIEVRKGTILNGNCEVPLTPGRAKISSTSSSFGSKTGIWRKHLL